MLIVGLGNPGDKYIYTPHNAGFMFLDFLSEKLNLAWCNMKDKAVAKNDRITLIKPMTFMNLSGNCLQKYKNQNIIVAFDDLELQIGSVRCGKNSYKTSHNGFNSVKNAMHPDSIITGIRIGINNGMVENRTIYTTSKMNCMDIHKLHAVIQSMCTHFTTLENMNYNDFCSVVSMDGKKINTNAI